VKECWWLDYELERRIEEKGKQALEIKESVEPVGFKLSLLLLEVATMEWRNEVNVKVALA
jgi:hypothetical protein